MKLIIGLGNPGKNYENTRHNIGFSCVEKLQKVWDFPDFSLDKKFEANLSESLFENHKVLLIKPHTFMNLSGKCVRSFLDFYKLTPNDIFVVHDELDIPFGSHKIATNSSSAGHNGVQNIIDMLGTQAFHRLRIGIATPHNETLSDPPIYGQDAKYFVLGKFTPEEQQSFYKTFPIYEEILRQWISEGSDSIV